nr:hypothetical protein [Streptomyces xantholiticus]
MLDEAGAVPETRARSRDRRCSELLAAMRSRLRRLDDQMERLTQSRDALADYIDAAERMGSVSYPPFDDADVEPVTA